MSPRLSFLATIDHHQLFAHSPTFYHENEEHWIVMEPALASQNTTSPSVPSQPSILTAASTLTINIGNDGENFVPLQATINLKPGQHELDGSTLMDIDMDSMPPCLPSLKKKAQAAVSVVTSPSPWPMPDGAMEQWSNGRRK